MPPSSIEGESLTAISKGSSECYFARQPILDCRESVFGYEFLFRPDQQNCFPCSTTSESDNATRQMVDNSILYDFKSLTGRGKAFLNCTRDALIGGWMMLLPPQSSVLEILEDIEPDDEVVGACRLHRERGYQIALDDFVPRPGMERLIPLADYIKIDFQLSGPSDRAEILRELKGSRARLIAEKIENKDEFRQAMSEGFGLFQGFFFCRPAMIAKKRFTSSDVQYLRLLTAVSRSPFSWSEIEQMVRHEAALCYRVLLLVNSGEYLARNEIFSIHTALVTLGEERFRKLVTVAITTSVASGKPPEILRMTLHRARFCELAAPLLGQDATEQYLFGLLSLLPALLGVTTQQLADLLPLRNAVKLALLGQENEVSAALNLLKAYELEQWTSLPESKLGICQIDGIYRESLEWSVKTLSTECG